MAALLAASWGIGNSNLLPEAARRANLVGLVYSAVRHIWRTKVRCSSLFLLHNFLFKPIPV
jgi:hypothetical protein